MYNISIGFFERGWFRNGSNTKVDCMLIHSSCIVCNRTKTLVGDMCTFTKVVNDCGFAIVYFSTYSTKEE